MTDKQAIRRPTVLVEIGRDTRRILAGKLLWWALLLTPQADKKVMSAIGGAILVAAGWDLPEGHHPADGEE